MSPVLAGPTTSRFSRLVVATDFSPAGRRAARFAGALLAPGGRLRLLHVFDARRFESPAPLTAAREWAAERLEEEREDAHPDGGSVDSRLAVGAPHLEIPREAAFFSAEAIVCGTHRGGPLRRALLGSVAERVVASARVPVLVVPPVPRVRRVRRALVAIDFSPAADAAVDLALALARPRGWSLVLHHVLERPAHGTSLRADPSSIRETDDRRAEAAAALRRIRERAARSGLEASARLDGGEVAARIVKVAAEEGADLILIGTRGLSRLERFLLGSVASKVVRSAPCPILVVPAPRPAARRSGR